MNSSDGTQEEKMAKLRSDVKRGKWPKVFETFVQERALRMAKITEIGDTVLHMAVSNGQEKMVSNMVNLLVLEQNKLGQNNVVVTVDEDGEESWNVNSVLGAENDRKNTPLHLAATMGNVEMCRNIGGADPSLIARRNVVGETPIFLAALNGRKEVFLWLYYQYMSHPRVSPNDFAHCIRDNDDTILHCTIARGHFDVAIEIIHLYKDHLKEIMRRNKEGLSPLHLLAAKHSAFKSTSLLELSILGHPIYWLLKVEEKNQATTLEELHKCLKGHIEAKVTLIQKRFCIICQNIVKTTARWFYQIQKMKESQKWSLQIMNELLQHASHEDMSHIISRTVSEHLSISMQTEEFNESELGTITIETPLMIATKNGVVEMVEKILELFPSSIKDVNSVGKNIVLLAAEYRQTEVYRFLCKQAWLSASLFGEVDEEGNNALHLAAKLGVEPDWLNSGEALTMLREINWFEFVKNSTPHDLLERYNKKMETPEDIFRESHKELMKSEGKWAARTSQACSVVSTLVVSVAFATRTSVPGGYDPKGYAILRNKQPVFKVFEVSSFMALFSSLISTLCFLSIVASRSQSVNSWKYVPSKLYFGMYFMFVSIVGLWISFCASDFFTLDEESEKLNNALPAYIFLSSGIILLVVTQLPTFLGPTLSSILPIPAPRRKATRPIEYRRIRN